MQQNFKSGFVTIVGRPNVGKSTLMNKIIGQKIAITSNKPQTTRNRIMTVYTSDEGQIVFLDTPGLHKAKNKLGNYMMNAANASVKDADVVLFMIEANKPIGNAEKDIIEEEYYYDDCESDIGTAGNTDDFAPFAADDDWGFEVPEDLGHTFPENLE